MSDWEDAADEWEAEGFQPPALGAAAAAAPAQGAFDDEDADDDSDVRAAQAAAAAAAPKVKKNKEKAEAKKKEEEEIDALVEKLRANAQITDKDMKALEDQLGTAVLADMAPATAPDFDAFGKILAYRHVRPHVTSPYFLALVKGIVKLALADAPSADIKAVETAVVAQRNARLKQEKAARTTSSDAFDSGKKSKKKLKDMGDIDDFLGTNNKFNDVDEDVDFM